MVVWPPREFIIASNNACPLSPVVSAGGGGEDGGEGDAGGDEDGKDEEVEEEAEQEGQDDEKKRRFLRDSDVLIRDEAPSMGSVG